MAKDSYKSRGAMLVEDEPNLPRPRTAYRSRVEKEFLPDSFVGRFPARQSGFADEDVRVRRRAPVKKGIMPAWMKTKWGRIVALALLIVFIGAAVAAALAVRSFFDHDPRFRIDSSDSIQTVGNSQLTRDDLLSVFGSDIGRNIFYIPMAKRRAELEQIPWVEHATVMRILPNQLRVSVRERTPAAFVRIGNQIKLLDGAGVILDMSPAMMAARHFSFPVVTGISARDPLPTRAARMQLYTKFVSALDSTGEHLSLNLSEVNLSDPEDVRATVPMKSSDLLLYFGDQNFLARYRIYQVHLSEWEQQYPQLASVDLRYDSEVVLKMGPGAGSGAAEGAKASGSGSGSAQNSKAVGGSKAVPEKVAKHAAPKKQHSAKKPAARKKK